jgi:hypothetical protein
MRRLSPIKHEKARESLNLRLGDDDKSRGPYLIAISLKSETPDKHRRRSPVKPDRRPSVPAEDVGEL